ncbi:hypothetical protein L6Q21_14430 [Sandaracinobacter sp. RS1-74]|uniref:helix-turn-helix transcriptional regulator n=1 Tax=Sandaracinobacteroides sayramensis TaxID=2913411 RepID=UPI001EDAD82D|nr:hypothetical protein [Sandaracinobacteroides sayramensis]MCG2842178.1 hypothetical protein [Sandaracinobacteroides sayramensis]
MDRGDLFEHIYAAVEDDAALEALPQRFADLVGCRSATLIHVTADGALRSFLSNYWPEEILGPYVEGGYDREDPWVPAATAPGALNRIQALDALVPPERVVNSRFGDFHRARGDDTARAVGGRILLDDGMVGLAAQAGLRAPPFEAQHVARLQPLVPHIRRLYDLRQRLAVREGPARAEALAAEGLIDGMTCGVILAAANGRILFLNRTARRMLERSGGLRVTAGILWAPEAGPRLARAMALAAARRGDAFDALEIRGGDDIAWRLCVCPWTLEGRSCALVTIDEPRAGAPGAARLAGRLHGLTAAETAILDALLAGLSPEETARRREVSIATVRTQVQQLLRKTGTSRIGEMLAQVGRLPALGRFEEPDGR